MTQHDYVVDNAAGSVVRADINAVLAAIVGNNSGASNPGATYAYMWWADTTAMLLKMRDSTNASWITVGTLDAAFLGLLTKGAANTWTVGGQQIQDTDAGAAAIVALTLHRASSSPLAADLLEALDFSGMNTSAAQKTYARLITQIIDAAAASEDGQLEFWTVVAGTLARRGFIGQGLVVGATTDGGSGVINAATDVRIAGTSVAFTAATQAQQEAASSNVVGVTPGRQHFHPGSFKAWAKISNTGVPAISQDYGCSSVTDNGVGDITINFDTSFSASTYVYPGCCQANATNQPGVLSQHPTTGPATGSCRFITNLSNNTLTDLDCSTSFAGDV